MAKHEIPQDGTKHLGRDCPCRPSARKRRDRGVIRTVYVHTSQRSADVVDQGVSGR